MKKAIQTVTLILVGLIIFAAGGAVGQVTAPEQVPEVCTNAVALGAQTITDTRNAVADNNFEAFERATDKAERFLDLALECDDIG